MLSVTEILIAILEVVPVETLIHLQRVNTKFKDVIQHSPALQRAMFFRAQERGPTFDEIMNSSPKTGAKLIRPFYRYPEMTMINTLLQKKFPAWFQQYHYPYGKDYYYGKPHAPSPPNGIDALSHINESFTRHGATWRQMLVSQPPIRKLQVVVVDLPERAPARIRSKMFDFSDTDPLGIRMGTLYDLVQGFLHENRSFAVDWWEYTWKDTHNDLYDHVPEGYDSTGPLPLPKVLKEMRISEASWAQPNVADLLSLILSAHSIGDVDRDCLQHPTDTSKESKDKQQLSLVPLQPLQG